MKIKYPAEAFALGMVLFSAGMKEAFAAGILVILAVVFAEVLKNLLESRSPRWSLMGCVCVGTAAISSSAFLLGFSALGLEMEWGTWLMTLILGLFAAKHVISENIDAEYGELLWESAVCWGFWILFAIGREFFGTGEIFGNLIMKAEFQSGIFQDVIFGFLTAGISLACANSVLKKNHTDTRTLWLVIPLALFMRPFDMESFGQVAGLIWTAAVPVVLFWSVQKTLKFANTWKAFRGLPVEMLSMGFIYMILSIY